MKAAIIQSTFDFAIREINALETKIAKAEDDADSMLWEQATQVVAQLDAGLSQRDLAAQWLKPTGEPYSKKHVQNVAAVVSGYLNIQPRPRFRDAYNEVANPKSVHHSSESVEHYTPKEFLDLVIKVMGAIDLDPCCNPGKPNVPAKKHFTEKDNGLEQPWAGRVFVNPPYGNQIGKWAEKTRTEWNSGNVRELIALLPARPDTEWWNTLTAETDDAVACFWYGRLTFVNNEDPAPFPSVVIYFGPKQNRFSRIFGEKGGLWVRPPIGFFVSH